MCRHVHLQNRLSVKRDVGGSLPSSVVQASMMVTRCFLFPVVCTFTCLAPQLIHPQFGLKACRSIYEFGLHFWFDWGYRRGDVAVRSHSIENRLTSLQSLLADGNIPMSAVEGRDQGTSCTAAPSTCLLLGMPFCCREFIWPSDFSCLTCTISLLTAMQRFLAFQMKAKTSSLSTGCLPFLELLNDFRVLEQLRSLSLSLSRRRTFASETSYPLAVARLLPISFVTITNFRLNNAG